MYQAIRRYPDYMRLFPDTLGLIGFDAEGWTRMTTQPFPPSSRLLIRKGLRAMEELADILDGKKSRRGRWCLRI